MLDVFSYVKACSLVGAGLAIGLGAIGSAIGEGLTAGKANETLSYRPELAGEILKTMLVGQAVAESAAIFALVVAMLMFFTNPVGKPLLAAWAFLGSGLGMGLSAIGSGIGSGFVSATACEGIGRQPAAKSAINSLMLIGASITQSTAIYGFLVSLMLLFIGFPESADISRSFALLGAGLSTGFGGIGPGIGEGLTGSFAVTAVARNPEQVSKVTRTMLVGQAIAESTGIYALIVALLLIMVV
ncbi:MAG: hypothetical protein B1H12_09140 [Desulfobacteraceae bacterium 4484_190.2]|nr:MAG: hypothetical protein B1H12_09140 [Desulfobacteraceae bacterium 4484_190.2]